MPAPDAGPAALGRSHAPSSATAWSGLARRALPASAAVFALIPLASVLTMALVVPYRAFFPTGLRTAAESDP